MIYQSDALAPEEIEMRKNQRDTTYVTSSLSSSMEESGLSGGTRVKVTTEKRIPKKNKYIKPKVLSPFHPGNKIPLNADNDYNPETTNTSLSGKYDM